MLFQPSSPCRWRLLGRLCLAAWLLGSLPTAAPAQTPYRTPPKAIADLVDAPLPPVALTSPRRTWLLLADRPALPPIAEVAQPELRLGGIRFNPRTTGPSQPAYLTGLTLLRLGDGTKRPVTGLPSPARLGDLSWSPDERSVAFTHTTSDRVELWLLDVEKAAARRVGNLQLNAIFGRPFVWLPNSQGLLCRTVPPKRGTPPAPPAAPDGPIVQENRGRATAARTFQDLLRNPYDEALFDYYLTAQLVQVGLNGQARNLGEPALFQSALPSPNGQYVLAQMLHRPYSYTLPAAYFPLRIEVWDSSGKVVREIADLPLRDDIPTSFDATAKGPRGIQWRSDAPATLAWVEAQDGGNPAVAADIRDRLFFLAAPFSGEPTPSVGFAYRFGGIQWGTGQLALAYESWRKTRLRRTWRFQPDAPDVAPTLIHERSSEDRYADPGNVLTQAAADGTVRLLSPDNGKTLYLVGEGASPEGDRPFLDRFEVSTGQTTRLWRSEAPYYESPVALLDPEAKRVLLTRESPTEPPNYFIRDMATGKLTALTDFPHPTPQLVGIQKEQIRYKRADGVDLTGTLYLPPGYDPKRDGPLPLMLWAYPQEFVSAAAAGQVQGSPYRFTRVSYWGPLFLLTQGYAVLDDPSFPIIGEGGREPNDTYIEQLVASAKAAIDECARRGVADPNRVAVGGHSYGAFMTANLLAHSRLFRAGIARSGAYNRTLTPFGFQAEERTYWQAREIYQRMSPFNYADQIRSPLLLIHGEADDNSGTFPIQSERLFQAVKGLGGTVRLVMLPHERHGYRARESILHMLWETHTWLEEHVKQAKPLEAETSPGNAQPGR
ncbi:S9 family peptidase [Chloracidobacterium validum]|uniref:S9 family peptidase n=1 Tax=Chloracidobacterium validum TaxID=2821543 RepID=A0ABX8BDY5_9BACT|nr:prolyl oligopeptidase family serine peptidase [Chloracidobacterium validum]QUW04236.1 S9 family peptidase [Chloracidobacterium validum]